MDQTPTQVHLPRTSLAVFPPVPLLRVLCVSDIKTKNHVYQYTFSRVYHHFEDLTEPFVLKWTTVETTCGTRDGEGLHNIDRNGLPTVSLGE